MKPKKEYIVLGIIIIALSVYLAIRNTDNTRYKLPDLPEISVKDISRLEITGTEKSVILNRKDNKWYTDAEAYLTDSNKVGKMLETIGKLTLTALVSESKSYNRYDLDKDKKINIKAWNGDKLAREFDIGKTAASYRHTFVKLPDDDNVYHGRDNFRNKFEISLEDLRDKTVLSFDKNQIQAIHVSKKEKTIILTKNQASVTVDINQTQKEPETKTTDTQPPVPEETFWQTTDNRKFDEKAIDPMLTSLSTLKCSKYINGKTKADFTNPICILQLKGTEEYSISIFANPDKESKDYPAISSANDYPFIISSWQADKILENQKKILNEPEEEKK